jgi:cysteine synthase A
MSDNRQWAREAIRIIEADFQRSADTHLIPLPLPGFPGIELYFKDESSHPTGSLKHRWLVLCSSMRCVMAGSSPARR